MKSSTPATIKSNSNTELHLDCVEASDTMFYRLSGVKYTQVWNKYIFSDFDYTSRYCNAIYHHYLIHEKLQKGYLQLQPESWTFAFPKFNQFFTETFNQSFLFVRFQNKKQRHYTVHHTFNICMEKQHLFFIAPTNSYEFSVNAFQLFCCLARHVNPSNSTNTEQLLSEDKGGWYFYYISKTYTHKLAFKFTQVLLE